MQDVVLVTGGGSGIGRATALRVARDGGIAAVVDRDARERRARRPRRSKRAGGRATAYPCDVATTRRSQEAVAAANAELGRVGGVVTAAGIFHGPDLQPAHEVTVDDFVHVLAREPRRHVRRDQARACRPSSTAAARS